jgi:GLPGLI family protein
LINHIFIGFTVLIALPVFGQSDVTKHVAHYTLTHYPDHPSHTRDERMVLLIGDTYAQFRSYDFFVRDSILDKQIESGRTTLDHSDPNIPRGSSAQHLIKALGQPKGYVTNWLYNHFYWEETWSVLAWELHPDTSTIAGLKCQKATAQSESSGRVWTVWFTAEIPISTGPLLMEGLPGLIVQAKDDAGSALYQLESFGAPTPALARIALPEPSLKSTRAEFERAQVMAKEDMEGFLNQSGMMRGTISNMTMTDANGNVMSSEEFLKRKKEKENLEKKKQ